MNSIRTQCTDQTDFTDLFGRIGETFRRAFPRAWRANGGQNRCNARRAKTQYWRGLPADFDLRGGHGGHFSSFVKKKRTGKREGGREERKREVCDFCPPCPPTPSSWTALHSGARPWTPFLGGKCPPFARRLAAVPAVPADFVELDSLASQQPSTDVFSRRQMPAMPARTAACRSDAARSDGRPSHLGRTRAPLVSTVRPHTDQRTPGGGGGGGP